MSQYIYLVRPARFLLTGESTYKIGKTTQTVIKYISTKYKDCELICVLKVLDCHTLETKIIACFDKLFLKRRDLGLEYYSGDVKTMRKVLELLNNLQEAEHETEKQLQSVVEHIKKVKLRNDKIAAVEILFNKDNNADELGKINGDDNVNEPDEINEDPKDTMCDCDDIHNSGEEYVNYTLQTVTSLPVFVDKYKKTAESFYEFIFSTRPQWYLENKYVDIEIIEKAYKSYFNTSKLSRAMIVKHINPMFANSTRVSGITKKKLVPFDTLEELFRE